MPTQWANSTRTIRLPTDWRGRRRRVLERDAHLCQIAGPRCAYLAAEVDHIIANDDHSLANLQAACHTCHQAKTIAEREVARPRRTRPGEHHPGLRLL